MSRESNTAGSGPKQPVSKIRKIYIARLIGRCIILVLSVCLFLFHRQSFSVVEKDAFFEKFSVFHILWLIWLIDMLYQLIPAKSYISLGSQKHFLSRFRPIVEKINTAALKKHIIATTRAAYKVMVIWVALTLLLGALHLMGVLNNAAMLLISVVFYVCDLICVLVWCPFRLIMKNRCCTTCRIFNWDHLMMFSHLVFVGGFYALSLFFMSLVVWLVWELCVILHPERFWEGTNGALRCSECTDKLCTQYCRKLRS